MKIELTIKTDYLPEWGAVEGIRELLQNGKDAETEFSAELKVDHYNDTLRIENAGCRLPYEALLLGHTTKVGREDMIGKFGEGLKLGILALVRAGHPVKIRSGSEVWVPRIEQSDKFNAKVLTFQIQSGREDKNRVRVEIGGVTVESWKELRKHYLFLSPPKDSDMVSTYYGRILLAPEYRGKIYVKGIFVEFDPKAEYGYDLAYAQLDRDRKMVERWDRDSKLRDIWQEAIGKRPDLFPTFYSMLERETPEVAGVSEYSASYFDAAAKTKVAETFAARFGADAVPVANLGESSEIEHYGRKGIVVPKPLAALLRSTMGSLDSVKQELRQEVLKKYSWHELSDDERANLRAAIDLVNHGAEIKLEDVDVADFRSADLMGQFKDGRVLVAKRLLVDFQETLATLVHEVAHRNGGDGEKAHVAQIEKLWSTICTFLWKAQR